MWLLRPIVPHVLQVKSNKCRVILLINVSQIVWISIIPTALFVRAALLPVPFAHLFQIALNASPILTCSQGHAMPHVLTTKPMSLIKPIGPVTLAPIIVWHVPQALPIASPAQAVTIWMGRIVSTLVPLGHTSTPIIARRVLFNVWNAPLQLFAKNALLDICFTTALVWAPALPTFTLLKANALGVSVHATPARLLQLNAQVVSRPQLLLFYRDKPAQVNANLGIMETRF